MSFISELKDFVLDFPAKLVEACESCKKVWDESDTLGKVALVAGGVVTGKAALYLDRKILQKIPTIRKYGLIAGAIGGACKIAGNDSPLKGAATAYAAFKLGGKILQRYPKIKTGLAIGAGLAAAAGVGTGIYGNSSEIKEGYQRFAESVKKKGFLNTVKQSFTGEQGSWLNPPTEEPAVVEPSAPKLSDKDQCLANALAWRNELDPPEYGKRKYAYDRIFEAYENPRARAINLAGLGLTSLPDAFYALKTVSHLDVTGNLLGNTERNFGSIVNIAHGRGGAYKPKPNQIFAVNFGQVPLSNASAPPLLNNSPQLVAVPETVAHPETAKKLWNLLQVMERKKAIEKKQRLKQGQLSSSFWKFFAPVGEKLMKMATSSITFAEQMKHKVISLQGLGLTQLIVGREPIVVPIIEPKLTVPPVANPALLVPQPPKQPLKSQRELIAAAIDKRLPQQKQPASSVVSSSQVPSADLPQSSAVLRSLSAQPVLVEPLSSSQRPVVPNLVEKSLGESASSNVPPPLPPFPGGLILTNSNIGGSSNEPPAFRPGSPKLPAAQAASSAPSNSSQPLVVSAEVAQNLEQPALSGHPVQPSAQLEQPSTKCPTRPVVVTGDPFGSVSISDPVVTRKKQKSSEPIYSMDGEMQIAKAWVAAGLRESFQQHTNRKIAFGVIAAAYADGREIISLNGLNLTSLPDSFKALTNARILNVLGNKLGEVSLNLGPINRINGDKGAYQVTLHEVCSRNLAEKPPLRHEASATSVAGMLSLQSSSKPSIMAGSANKSEAAPRATSSESSSSPPNVERRSTLERNDLFDTPSHSPSSKSNSPTLLTAENLFPTEEPQLGQSFSPFRSSPLQKAVADQPLASPNVAAHVTESKIAAAVTTSSRDPANRGKITLPDGKVVYSEKKNAGAQTPTKKEPPKLTGNEGKIFSIKWRLW